MRHSMWRIVGLTILVVFSAGYPQQRRYHLFTDAGRNFVEVNPDNGANSIRIELDGSKFAEYVMALLTSAASINPPGSGNIVMIYKVPSTRPNGNFDGVEFMYMGGSYTHYIDILRGVPTPTIPAVTTEVAVQWCQNSSQKGPIFLFQGASQLETLKFDYAVSSIIQTILKEPDAWLNVTETHSADFRTFDLILK